MILSCNKKEEIYISVIDLFIRTQSIGEDNIQDIVALIKNNNNIDYSVFGPEFDNLNSDQQNRIVKITNINWSSSLERRCYINQYMKRYVNFINKWLVDNNISNNSNIIKFVDIGCGPGTASIAFLNYIYFHQERFPNLRNIEIILIDHKNNACEAAKKIILDFTNFWFLVGSQSHIRSVQITINSQCVSDNLDNINIPGFVDYLMCSNVVCELNNFALDVLRRIISTTQGVFLFSDCVLFDKFDQFCLSNNKSALRYIQDGITLKWFDRGATPSDHGPSLADTLATKLKNKIIEKVKEKIVDEIDEAISNSEDSETPRTGPPVGES